MHGAVAIFRRLRWIRTTITGGKNVDFGVSFLCQDVISE